MLDRFPSPEEAESLSRGMFTGRRVLLVEDEMMVAWLMEDMLIELGCEVLGPATCVAEALSIIEAVAPDAAVLDVNLGDERSFPIADALRARGVPVVFMTGYGKSSLPEPYRNFPLAPKPPERATVRACLAEALGNAGGCGG